MKKKRDLFCIVVSACLVILAGTKPIPQLPDLKTHPLIINVRAKIADLGASALCSHPFYPVSRK